MHKSKIHIKITEFKEEKDLTDFSIPTSELNTGPTPIRIN